MEKIFLFIFCFYLALTLIMLFYEGLIRFNLNKCIINHNEVDMLLFKTTELINNGKYEIEKLQDDLCDDKITRADYLDRSYEIDKNTQQIIENLDKVKKMQAEYDVIYNKIENLEKCNDIFLTILTLGFYRPLKEE